MSPCPDGHAIAFESSEKEAFQILLRRAKSRADGCIGQCLQDVGFEFPTACASFRQVRTRTAVCRFHAEDGSRKLCLALRSTPTVVYHDLAVLGGPAKATILVILNTPNKIFKYVNLHICIHIYIYIHLYVHMCSRTV